MEESAKQPCQHDHHEHRCTDRRDNECTDHHNHEWTDHNDCDHHDHDHHARNHAEKEGSRTGTHVEAHLHEGAVVASGELRMLTGDDAQIREILGCDMTVLAKWVEKSDGIIGHIKASLEATRTDMFSITDCELSEKSSDAVMVHVRIAAIVYGVESAEILARLKGLLEHLESVGTPV